MALSGGSGLREGRVAQGGLDWRSPPGAACKRMTGKRDACHVLALALLLIPFTSAHGQPVPDHLKCYKVKDSRPKASYTADLGGLVPEPGCRIKVPAKLLCVETAKTNVQPSPPGGSPANPAGQFACYTVKCPKTVPPTVAWLDQFGAGTLTPSTAKLLCAPGTTMFCSGAGDCPIGTACNTTTGQCESACGDASHSICYGGCCGDGTCQPGTVASACGSGGACAVCDATNQSGSACVSGHCGCTSAGDCPAGRACLLAGIYICTTECNRPNDTPCSGGCCSAAQNGTCQPGTADTACGNTGGTCVDCTSSLASCVNGTCAP